MIPTYSTDTECQDDRENKVRWAEEGATYRVRRGVLSECQSRIGDLPARIDDIVGETHHNMPDQRWAATPPSVDPAYYYRAGTV